MRTTHFGTFAGVPVIGLGTWKMESDDRAGAIAAIRAALDHGMTHLDTAELYGSGRVESIVGEAIAGRRDECFLVSKVMPSHASRKGTVDACEASLRRLGTDHLDGYLLHWPGNLPLEATIAAFEELVTAGKIRSWGVSNFDVPELEEALALAGPGKIACNQVLYHLEERAIEHAVLPWCEARGVSVVGYTPFGSGDFARRAGALEPIAKKHGVSVHAVALAFLTRRPALLAIPKSSRADRVVANGRAGDLVLDPDDVATIDRAFPRGPKPRELPTA